MMAIGKGSFFLKVKKKTPPTVQAAEGADIIFLLFLNFSGRILIGELDNSNGTLLDFCRKIAGFQLVRATNSKLLGMKILEVSKTFRVELENT